MMSHNMSRLQFILQAAFILEKNNKYCKSIDFCLCIENKIYLFLIKYP